MLKNNKLILLSVFFSFIANFNFLHSIIAYPASKDFLLSDLDESYYLRNPFDTYAFNSDMFFSHPEKFNFLSLPPFALIDLTIAKLGLSLSLTPMELGLLLDLLCGSIAFIGFYKFFKQILSHQSFTFLATTLFLLCPWIFIHIWEIFPFKFSTVTSAPSILFALPPIFRAFYTQTSMALLGFILFYFSKFFLDHNKNINHLRITGFLSGILINFYFFAWGSMVVALPCAIIFIHINFRLIGKSHLIDLLSKLLNFCLFALLGSSLGLIQIANAKSGGLADLPHYPKYWNINIETVILFLMFTIFSFKNHLSIKSKFLISLTQSLLVTELILHNIQIILNQVISTNHFSILYIRPLVSSIILCLIFIEIIKRSPASIMDSLVLRFLPFFFLIMISLRLITIPNFYGDDLKPLSQLMTAINSNTNETDTISMLTFDYPFEKKVDNMRSFSILPNIVHTITGRNLLFQNLAQPGQPEEIDKQFRRELLTGWIFSGKVQPIWPCISEMPELPGDIFYGTETAFRMNRRKACDSYEQYKLNLSICALLNEFEVNFIIFQTNNLNNLPQHISRYLKDNWSNKDHILYLFDHEKALEIECKNLPNAPLFYNP